MLESLKIFSTWWRKNKTFDMQRCSQMFEASFSTKKFFNSDPMCFCFFVFILICSAFNDRNEWNCWDELNCLSFEKWLLRRVRLAFSKGSLRNKPMNYKIFQISLLRRNPERWRHKILKGMRTEEYLRNSDISICDISRRLWWIYGLRFFNFI